MNTSRIFRVAALTIAAALPLHGMAMGTDVFRNGQSMYGQPAVAGAPSTQVVDVSRTKWVAVEQGDTITFQALGGKQFKWTFNGLGRTAVSLAKVAPADFPAAGVMVNVQANPLYIN
ncbi:CzcE family metal-binding protein [Aquabacterium sp. J223]|uniref:CzcE family metal-binding protein n=1 Tax=Aquabacterium sp. J223 TaxID=2898431 RepID=UPI0021ADC9C7|nr:CzcE family metal-binding protein [Aquabacterium sp. J223]UUX96663.1 CzcE family metal-binding protein [Aquabacterium sp. J223]